MGGKNKKMIFGQLFLNKDFSADIPHTPIIFKTYILEIRMQVGVSQSVDIGPSFYFMKCRNWHRKKSPKVTRILT